MAGRRRECVHLAFSSHVNLSVDDGWRSQNAIVEFVSCQHIQRFYCEVWFERAKKRTGTIGIVELSGEAEQLRNECGLRDRIVFRYPPHSALPDHVHRFDALQGPPRRRE